MIPKSSSAFATDGTASDCVGFAVPDCDALGNSSGALGLGFGNAGAGDFRQGEEGESPAFDRGHLDGSCPR